MGISRDGRHKRRLTGGRRSIHQKKRKFEMARPGANTKIGSKKVHVVRCRGGNLKFRALSLDSGNFTWCSQHIARKTRILGVNYHPSNSELVRTKTICKSSVVQIDVSPFKLWFQKKFGVDLSVKPDESNKEATAAIAAAVKKHGLDAVMVDQFQSGRVLACIGSRPGQCGRADGFLLEGEELAFYVKKMDKKKKQ